MIASPPRPASAGSSSETGSGSLRLGLRSGPAIRAVLAEVSPDECAQFEVEFARALARAGAEFDLAPAEAVLDRWWGIAVIRANPLSEREQEQLARAREGVFDGLWERDEAGNWVQL